MASACRLALKEWASVLRAMDRGEQLLLIRKGGLLDSAEGFELAGGEFLLYPTYEHQTVRYMRPPFAADFDQVIAQRSPQHAVRLAWWARAVESWRVHDPAVVAHLAPFHLYNDAFAAQRLKWQPQQPLVIAAIKVFRLPEAVEVPVLAHYAGCKSWVELSDPVSLEGSAPVLDEAAFAERLSRIRAIARRFVDTPQGLC